MDGQIIAQNKADLNQDGIPGNPGLNGGHLLMMVASYSSLPLINISGGHGSNGQNGGDG